jgi:hypothetical protein
VQSVIIILQIQVINCSSAFKFKTVMVNNSTNTNINEQISHFECAQQPNNKIQQRLLIQNTTL